MKLDRNNRVVQILYVQSFRGNEHDDETTFDSSPAKRASVPAHVGFPRKVWHRLPCLSNRAGVVFFQRELRTKVVSCAELERAKRIGEGPARSRNRQSGTLKSTQRQGVTITDAPTVMAAMPSAHVKALPDDRKPLATANMGLETTRIPQFMPKHELTTKTSKAMLGESLFPAVVLDYPKHLN